MQCDLDINLFITLTVLALVFAKVNCSCLQSECTVRLLLFQLESRTLSDSLKRGHFHFSC